MKILAATILLISSAITIYIGRVSSANHAPFIRAIRERDGVPCDTVIDMGIYKSYFDTFYREPLVVTYKLALGSKKRDSLNRKDLHLNFTGVGRKRTWLGEHMARAIDYRNNKDHYQRGHMANADDFSYNRDREKMTFKYYNCVPQTGALNQGAYREWEDSIRSESETDSLLIICGNIFGIIRMGPDGIAIPDTCFKVVQSLRTGSILHVLIFKNETAILGDKWPKCDQGTYALAGLEKRIGYSLPLKQ